MSADPADVLSAALLLPDEARADVAYRLLQSLKPSAILSDDDPNLGDELERRVAAYEAGETSASEWQDVSKRLRAALDERAG